MAKVAQLQKVIEYIVGQTVYIFYNKFVYYVSLLVSSRQIIDIPFMDTDKMPNNQYIPTNKNTL